MAKDYLVPLIVALLGGGLAQFITSLLRRKPELRQLDATTTNLNIQSAEKALAVVTRALDDSEQRVEKAQGRVLALEEKLAEKETKISELEARVESMQAHVVSLLHELDIYRAELSLLRGK